MKLLRNFKNFNPIHVLGLSLVLVAQLATFGGSWILFNEAEVPESLKK